MTFIDWIIVTCITGVIFCYWKVFEHAIAIYRITKLLKKIKKDMDKENE